MNIEINFQRLLPYLSAQIDNVNHNDNNKSFLFTAPC